MAKDFDTRTVFMLIIGRITEQNLVGRDGQDVNALVNYMCPGHGGRFDDECRESLMMQHPVLDTITTSHLLWFRDELNKERAREVPLGLLGEVMATTAAPSAVFAIKLARVREGNFQTREVKWIDRQIALYELPGTLSVKTIAEEVATRPADWVFEPVPSREPPREKPARSDDGARRRRAAAATLLLLS